MDVPVAGVRALAGHQRWGRAHSELLSTCPAWNEWLPQCSSSSFLSSSSSSPAACVSYPPRHLPHPHRPSLLFSHRLLPCYVHRKDKTIHRLCNRPRPPSRLQRCIWFSSTVYQRKKRKTLRDLCLIFKRVFAAHGLVILCKRFTGKYLIYLLLYI